MSLLCCAYPERFRKTLWEIGGENGWNSNPRLRIYFYANYQQPPEIPLIWTQHLSESNLAVSILTAAIFSAKVALTYFGVSPLIYRLFGVGNDMVLSGFWMYSVIAQSSSDLTDPDHLSVRPWYLEKSCSILNSSVASNCYLAKTCFVFSALSLAFYLARSIWSVLQFTYWCGKMRVFERGIKGLDPLQGVYVDGYGGIAIRGLHICLCDEVENAITPDSINTEISLDKYQPREGLAYIRTSGLYE
ncbi:hypothetical protein M426DRAFT_25449 [Hypoxylon sp. CI-4A]|nr:hypothetical protein M426DRAFT_25449 [Hypoxylon sp. CI-4A]